MTRPNDIQQLATRADRALGQPDDTIRERELADVNRDLARIAARDRSAIPAFTAEMERLGALPRLILSNLGDAATQTRLGLSAGAGSAGLEEVAAARRGSRGENARPLDRVAAAGMLDGRAERSSQNMTPEQVRQHYSRVQFAGGVHRAAENLRELIPSIATGRDGNNNPALTRTDIENTLANGRPDRTALSASERRSLEFLRDNFDDLTGRVGQANPSERRLSVQDMQKILQTQLNDEHQEYRRLTDGNVRGLANPRDQAFQRGLVEQSRARPGDGPDRIARRMLGEGASAQDVVNLSNEMMRRFVQNNPGRQLVNRDGRQQLNRLLPGEALISEHDVEELAQRFPLLRRERAPQQQQGQRPPEQQQGQRPPEQQQGQRPPEQQQGQRPPEQQQGQRPPEPQQGQRAEVVPPARDPEQGRPRDRQGPEGPIGQGGIRGDRRRQSPRALAEWGYRPGGE